MKDILYKKLDVIIEPMSLTIDNRIEYVLLIIIYSSKSIIIENVDICITSNHYSYFNDFYGNIVMFKYRSKLLTERPSFAFMGNAKQWLKYAYKEIKAEITQSRNIRSKKYITTVLTNLLIYVSLWKRFLLYGNGNYKENETPIPDQILKLKVPSKGTVPKKWRCNICKMDNDNTKTKCFVCNKYKDNDFIMTLKLNEENTKLNQTEYNTLQQIESTYDYDIILTWRDIALDTLFVYILLLLLIIIRLQIKIYYQNHKK